MRSLPNILVVDDQEVNLVLLQKIVTNFNVNLIQAMSGPEALEKIKGLDLALAIIDMRMPGMNGFNLAIKLNEYRIEEKVPVIIITASGLNEKEISEGYASGAVDYIIKPISTTIVRSKILVFLDLFRQKQIIKEKAEQLRQTADKLAKVNEAYIISESRLNDVIFSMADWVWEVDINGKYTYSSQNSNVHLGYSQEEIIGKTPFDFMAPEERKRIGAFFSAIIENKAPIKNLENWNVSKDGKKICLLTNGVPIFDEDGNFKGYRGVDQNITQRYEHEQSLRAYQFELERQNNELILANKQTKASSKKFFDLYDFAPSGYFTLTENKRILEFNRSGSQMLGLNKKHNRLKYKNFDAYISKNSLQLFNEFFEKAYQINEKVTCEVLLENETLPPKYVYIEGLVHYPEKQCLIVLIDITERKIAEHKLKTGEANLEEAQRIASIGSWEWDLNGKALAWSKEAFHIFDLDPETCSRTSESILKVLHPDDAKLFKGNLNSYFGGGNIIPPLDYRVIHKDGSVHYIHAEWKINFDRKGNPIRNIGTVQDVTKSRQTEQTRVQQEGLITSLLDTIPDLIFLKNIDGIYLNCNPSFAKYTGKSKEEIIGSTDYELFGEDIGDFFRFQDNEMLKQKASRRNEEWVTYPDGSQALLETLKTPYLASDGSTIGILGISRNITERKLAKDLLEQTRQNYETYFNTIDDFLFVSNENGSIIHANDTVSVRLGYSEEELKSKTVLSLHPVEYQDEVSRIMNEMLSGKSVHCPIPLVTKSGVQIPVETRIIHGVWDSKAAIFVVTKDISQIKLSEEKFSKVFYLNPSACGLTDLNTGKYMEVNDAFYALFGFNQDEVIGKSPEELGILTQEARKSILINQNSHGSISNVEADLMAKNGKIKHVMLSAENIYIQDKIYLFTVVHDITDLKLAEQTIKLSEEKYRTMLNTSPDGILLVDISGIIKEISLIGLKLFGAVKRDDMVGKDIFRFIPDDDHNTFKEIVDKTMNEGLIQNVEMNLRKKNQSIFAGETSATLIQGQDGIPISFMIIIRDISQRKITETKQFHADRMASLGEMAAGIAHEINQPLNIMSLVLDNVVYESSKADTINRDYLENKFDRIFENITRIRNIIDHVRAFSRSNDDYILTNFEINSSIRNAISLMTEQFKNLLINLELRLEKNLPNLIGNTLKFEQVIINLLSNAKDAVLEMKNRQPDDYKMLIAINSFIENQNLIVEIVDNGTGINEEDINNVMLPFYTTKVTGKGTGLGLSISYQIIKEMKGSIEIAKNKYHGTNMRLIFNIQN